MKFIYTQMPSKVADAIIQENFGIYKELKIDEKLKEFPNKELKIDFNPGVKKFEKEFRDQNIVSVFTNKESSFITFEISFADKNLVSNDNELKDIHYEHLTNIFEMVVDWFKVKFNKRPLSKFITEVSDVPTIILIFDCFRKTEQGNFKASFNSFFEFHKRLNDYPDLVNTKKITRKIKSNIISRLKSELNDLYGTINFGKYLN